MNYGFFGGGFERFGGSERTAIEFGRLKPRVPARSIGFCHTAKSVRRAVSTITGVLVGGLIATGFSWCLAAPVAMSSHVDGAERVPLLFGLLTLILILGGAIGGGVYGYHDLERRSRRKKAKPPPVIEPWDNDH